MAESIDGALSDDMDTFFRNVTSYLAAHETADFGQAWAAARQEWEPKPFLSRSADRIMTTFSQQVGKMPREAELAHFDKTIEALKMDFNGFLFTNLVDFDSKYGHRRDAVGYGKCIEEFDVRLPEIMEALGDDDILMITADHGNDPEAEGTDHTREYVPVIVYGKNCKKGVNLGIRDSFADVGATVADVLGVKMPKVGKSFKGEIL